MRRPEPVTLQISRGDWLAVKQRLTAKEHREIYKRMFEGGYDKYDALMHGLSICAAYLLDWNITDADDKPLVIQDKPPAEIMQILDALDADDYREIQKAVEAHVAAMDAERDSEKNGQSGEATSLLTSPSAETFQDGRSSMSGVLTEISTPSSSKNSRKKAAEATG